MQRWGQMFTLGEVPEYEPPSSASVEAVAAREGCSPQEVVLDWPLANDGQAFLFEPLASYVHPNPHAARKMMTYPKPLPSLSHGSAHGGLLSAHGHATARDRAT